MHMVVIIKIRRLAERAEMIEEMIAYYTSAAALLKYLYGGRPWRTRRQLLMFLFVLSYLQIRLFDKVIDAEK